jgi:hypothetical protein
MKKVFLSISAALLIMSCSITTPVAATSNEVGSKVGISKTNGLFDFFFFDGGDASIATAAKNGKISKISTVDFRKKIKFFGIIVSHETMITGE